MGTNLKNEIDYCHDTVVSNYSDSENQLIPMRVYFGRGRVDLYCSLMIQSLGCVIFSGDESGTKIDEGYLWSILEGLLLPASPGNLAPKHGTMGKVSNLRCRCGMLLKTGIIHCASEA